MIDIELNTNKTNQIFTAQKLYKIWLQLYVSTVSKLKEITTTKREYS